MNYYLQVLRNYTNFSGRARRSEYWMFLLFNILFGFVLMLMDNLLGFAIEGLGYGPLYILYALFVFIPGLAVMIRRLHDVGKSGWMALILFIPLIGVIWLIVLMATDGETGENKWGENPKAAIA